MTVKDRHDNTNGADLKKYSSHSYISLVVGGTDSGGMQCSLSGPRTYTEAPYTALARLENGKRRNQLRFVHQRLHEVHGVLVRTDLDLGRGWAGTCHMHGRVLSSCWFVSRAWRIRCSAAASASASASASWCEDRSAVERVEWIGGGGLRYRFTTQWLSFHHCPDRCYPLLTWSLGHRHVVHSIPVRGSRWLA